MSAAIGISSLLSLVACPTGCVITEVTSDQTKEFKEIKNSIGITVQAGLLPMITTKISVKGKGIPSFALIVATASILSGTVVATGLTVDEGNSDYPDFSMEAMKWS